jgi:hypothetical protein
MPNVRIALHYVCLVVKLVKKRRMDMLNAVESSRLERALIASARRHAPQLVPAHWHAAGDLRVSLSEFSEQLAHAQTLVIVGILPSDRLHQAGVLYKDWAETYIALYAALCASLFPSYPNVNAFYADSEFPAIVIIHGDCPPVIDTLAGFVAPYIATRQGAIPAPSDAELSNIAESVLDDLEAGDLPTDQFRSLRGIVNGHLRTLLASPVRQWMLTPIADRAPFAQANTPPPPPSTLPVDTPIPAMPSPPDLPEMSAPRPPSTLPPSFDVPLFFTPSARSESGKRPRPPLPDLPQ